MKIVFIIFSLLTSLVIKSQTGWDLQECISYSLKHNISLKQAALNSEINKNNTNQSKAAALPSLNVGAQHNYNFGQTIDRFTNTFANTQVLSQNFYVSSSVVLWSGLSQYNTIQANQYNYLSSIENVKQLQYDLSINVANAYIAVIFAEELLKISENQTKVTKEQLDRTLKLVNAGSVAKSIEYDIKAQLANEQVNVTTAENNLTISVLNLKQLMNLDSVTNFEIVRPNLNVEDEQLLTNSIQYIYETSVKNQPNIKSGEYSILSAEKSLAASKGRVSPTLTFNASMGTGTSGLAKDILGVNFSGYQLSGITNKGDSVYSPVTELITRKTSFQDQFNNNINKSIGFTLNIPLFNGLQTNTAIKNAKINTLNMRFSQDIAKQNLYKTISQAYVSAKAAFKKYAATKVSVDAANESFKYAQQKFDAGVISAFDFSTSKNRLFAAESNLLQAKYDYVFKLKVLDYYQGKPLGF
ncbi:MAG: TolC family protein [Bacteroidota bacterium]|nr:TolC family protein [Bacteroidota bacterium]MDP3144520.1 TolC family protein [Bacteroidota bacterium]MDP3555799.1 TolC family protein [Bacteroidota bacterium]